MSKGMRVLVTGGAGYVGSHAAKALAIGGFIPVTLDDLSVGHEWAVKYGPLVRGSIADVALVARTLEAHGIPGRDAFRGERLRARVARRPRALLRADVGGSMALLEACLASKRIRAFILSSTCATYGIPASTPIVESMPTVPISPYGESNSFLVEKMLEWYGRCHGLRWAALRDFNACGADPDGELGEVHEPETHIIPLAIDAARGGKPVPAPRDSTTPLPTAPRYVTTST